MRLTCPFEMFPYLLEWMCLVNVHTWLRILRMLVMALRLLMMNPLTRLPGWCRVARRMVWLLAAPTRLLSNTVLCCLLIPIVWVRLYSSPMALLAMRLPERLKRRLSTLNESPLMCPLLVVKVLPRPKRLVMSPLRRVPRVLYLGAPAVLMGVGTPDTRFFRMTVVVAWVGLFLYIRSKCIVNERSCECPGLWVFEW